MKRRISSIAWILAAALLTLPAPATRAGGLQELVDDARSAIFDFTSDPAMDWFRDNVKHAKGVLIIPRLLKGGFIFGGSGGSGVLVALDPQTGAWSYPAFYTLGSVTVGPQIGGEAAQVILLILTQRGLDSMMASSVKLGADVEVAAGPVGAGTKAVLADIVAYSRTKGFFGGATVEGAWVGEREGWNQEYYGSPVRPIEILLDRKVANPQADGLREALARVSTSVPSLRSP